MLFTSLQYVLFLPVVCALFHLAPHRMRWGLLLVASYYFYACWEPAYLLLIVASTLVDYGAGIAMGNRTTRDERRPFLMLSILVNLGLLSTFKYWNFFVDSVHAITGWAGSGSSLPYLHVLLPVGISYYTFQTLSYSVDVYRGTREPERHLGIFALYVSFFPQLVAGPIERSTTLLPQFRERQTFRYDDVAEGLRRILWGFFKKLVIADRLALYVDQVFSGPHEHTGYAVILVSYAFPYQVYCDFSAYSDIAIGSARMMGFRLMENFRSPFSAGSIAGFWRRWNISLMSWFMDYLYIPLGGGRVSWLHKQVNIMAVFALSGLWHGAAWTFVLYGTLHGIYVLVGAATLERRNALWRSIGTVLPGRWLGTVRYTLGLIVSFHLLAFSVFLFRAPNLSTAVTMLRNMFVFNADAISVVDVIGGYQLAVVFVAIAVLELGQWVERRGKHMVCLAAPSSRLMRWSGYYAVGMAVLLFGVFNNEEFIYFQF